MTTQQERLHQLAITREVLAANEPEIAAGFTAEGYIAFSAVPRKRTKQALHDALGNFWNLTFGGQINK